HLFAGEGVEAADGVIGATDGEQFAVRRPTQPVNRVESDWRRDDQGFLARVPDLHFAEAAGRSTGDRQPLAVGRERHRIDAFRDADKPRYQMEIFRGIEQHLVVAGDGEELALGIEIERRDDGWGEV